MRSIKPDSCGIGLREEHIDDLCSRPKVADIDFLELSPENWMDIGGRKHEALDNLADKYPFIAHGLSLSIGAGEPLNTAFLKRIRNFLDTYKINVFSEHLSFCCDSQGYIHELLPVPRCEENIAYLTDRIHRVQDIIDRPLALENISSYYRYKDDMPEDEFLLMLVERSGCQLLLDINNVYVNAVNHKFDAVSMIKGLPQNSISYYHVAGHLEEAQDFLLDTHGRSVSQSVVELTRTAFTYHGSHPLLLERDHFVPPLDELTDELKIISHQVLPTDLHAR